jgi:hypothetical protein
LSAKKDRSHIIFLESTLFPSTILSIPLEAGLVSLGGAEYQDQQERVLFTLDQLKTLPDSYPPKFVFAHIVAPHPAFVFDENGPINEDQPYTLEFNGTKEDYMKGYVGQLVFLNKRLEETIDAMLESSLTPPIIILQGDHGPGAILGKTKEETCLKERNSILNAYYLPGLQNNPVYETISPVNTFRTVFNEYFGTQFDILDDRTFFSSTDAAFEFFDVTDESGQACDLP